MAKVLDYSGLQHLIDRLDLRYIDTDEKISYAIINGILNGTITLGELEAAAAAAAPSSSGSPSGYSSGHSVGGDDNSTGDRVDRVLNYPGLQHLIERLDLRYAQMGSVATSVESADKLTTPRKIAVSGETVGEGYFDGSADLTIGTVVSRISNTELEEILI